MIKLLITTILAVTFILQMLRGKKYDYMVENLEGDEYPLKSIYSVGFGWNDTKILNMPAAIQEKLVGQANLLYEHKYVEYYVLLKWIQIVSFAHLSLLFGFIIGVVLKSVLYILLGIVLAIVSAYFYYSLMGKKIEKREKECEAELPEVVSTMALLVNSGMVLKEVWEIVAYSKEGTIYTLMQRCCADMKNGLSEADAIYRFGILSGSAEIKKFTSNVVQAVEKGSAELSTLLINQSTEIWNLKRQYMLQKGEAAASKLLGPIACIFIGIIIMVITGALGMLAS